ncbi:unnamed protein product [Prunus brigantina]
MNEFFLQSTTTPRKACKDPLYVVLSLVFIGRALESHSRLKRSSKNICLVESDWGKQVVQSAFGIVKYGGVTPINLGKSRPPP